jgi:hypothetical protein
MRSILAITFLTFLCSFVTDNTSYVKDEIQGAWQSGTDEMRITRIYAGEYFSIATYNHSGKEFISTSGGKFEIKDGKLIETIEFDTKTPDNVGNQFTSKVSFKKRTMTIEGDQKSSWSKVDDGTPGKLSGAWLITGRVRDGEVRRSTPGVRKTMKILSGTHFQWIAYNTETKEFFGTGGGTYTTVDGKYTEDIEFFSRDNSRVGASLSFDFSLVDGEWNHKGLSSKGDPIEEIWTKREVLDKK